MLQIFKFGKTITNSLSIYVKTTTGTLNVELDPDCNIKNVKEILAPKLGLEPDELKIIFAGKELSDSTTIRVCFFNVNCNQIFTITFSLFPSGM